MRYVKTFDIWKLDENQRKRIAIGQWVTAGENGPKGRFYGQGRTTVVAWLDNARRDYRSYMANIRDYGRKVSKTS